MCGEYTRCMITDDDRPAVSLQVLRSLLPPTPTINTLTVPDDDVESMTNTSNGTSVNVNSAKVDEDIRDNSRASSNTIEEERCGESGISYDGERSSGTACDSDTTDTCKESETARPSSTITNSSGQSTQLGHHFLLLTGIVSYRR